jgi:hypothetical protein
MKKRRINWSWGNPAFFAWAMDYPAGMLVVRHNHAPVRSGRRRCEGWDLWLDSRYLGAIGSRSFGELIGLSSRELVTLARTACCARHQECTFGVGSETTGKRGGHRPNAGRKPKGEAKRVRLSLTVDPETFALLERVRGESSRGQYIDHLIQSSYR